MDSKKWQEIKRIFNSAVELQADEQKLFLAKECGNDTEMLDELEKMLAFAEDEDENDSLERNVFELIPDQTSLSQPIIIGNYKIIRELGRGGMGIVYEALRETANFKQKAALKVIKRGMDTDAILSRFNHERQILASLEHPSIARFLDGGMTEEGLPFYAMEFVEGEFIDKYCDKNELPIEERLKLFQKVCSAVQYAHQNFIAHRDLKPSNILVTKDGSPKLLDFGIAKVLSQTEDEKTGTATQLGMMTPAYASPEQVRGEKVGVQSDVYSLGVILYELLTNQKPYSLKTNSPAEVIKVICESEPIRPSSIVNNSAEADKNRKFRIPHFAFRNLKGDLDNIILKALQKESERRYASVEQFSADIQRHLDGMPVLARSDTFSYRASKFFKRNKASVIAASIIFLALFAGIVATTYQTQIAQNERKRAEKRFEQVRKLANNVVFKYHDSIANLSGSTAVREMLVKDAIEYLDNLAQDAESHPELQKELAQAYLKIGNVQGESYRANLGDSGGALESFSKGIKILEDLLKKEPKNAVNLESLHSIYQSNAFLLVRMEKWKEAESAGDQLLNIAGKLVEIDPANLNYKFLLARSYVIKGDTMAFSGGYEENLRWYRQGLAEAEKSFAINPKDMQTRRVLVVAAQRIGTYLENYVEILKEKGNSLEELSPIYIEAEEQHRRSIETAQSLKQDFPDNPLFSIYVTEASINWGTSLARIGKGEEGVKLILSPLEKYQKNIKDDPNNIEAQRDLAELWQYMGFAYVAMNKPDDAVKSHQKSLEIMEKVTKSDSLNMEFLKQVHETYNRIGDILLQQNKLQESLSFYQKGLDYVKKMTEVNENPQITAWRAESNRELGVVYLVMAEKNKSSEFKEKALNHLSIAQEIYSSLKQKNQLGKNYEHKLDLTEKDLSKAKNL